MNPYYRCFETSDGFVAVACLNLAQRKAFLGALRARGRDDRRAGPRPGRAVGPRCQGGADRDGSPRRSREHSTDEWIERARVSRRAVRPRAAARDRVRGSAGRRRAARRRDRPGRSREPSSSSRRSFASADEAARCVARTVARRTHGCRARGALVNFDVPAELAALRRVRPRQPSATGSRRASPSSAPGRTTATTSSPRVSPQSAGRELWAGATSCSARPSPAAIELGRAAAPGLPRGRGDARSAALGRGTRAPRDARPRRSRCLVVAAASRSARPRPRRGRSRRSTAAARSLVDTERARRARAGCGRRVLARVERGDSRVLRRARVPIARARGRARAHAGAVRRADWPPSRPCSHDSPTPRSRRTR